jgi:2-polyprenyl-3-methyl-5-hydroxy-6-metoxy-1,4-benzoquinol methylase
MPLMETVAGADTCPVCGALGDRPIYSETRDPITLDYFQVVACSACGVAYTNPRPCSLDKYYPQGYRHYGLIVTRILGALYGMRVSRWARLAPAAGGSVLEVGCGPGLMLSAFQRRGWRVLGIERNEKVAAAARHALGVEIVATPVEGLPADSRFDLIIMFHVLEHIA